MAIRALVLAGIIAACAVADLARAADFPAKPLRLLVGFAPGGGADVVARALGAKLAVALDQQVIVDNRPGAGGNIATALLAKSEPDGHTLMLASLGQLAINPSLYSSSAFDVTRDLAPVTKVADATNIVCVHPGVAAANVGELAALAKTRSLNAGSAGIGSAGHLALELFNMLARTKIIHIPYKGGGPAMVGLVAGEVQVIFSNPAAAMPQVKSAKVKALAVTTRSRFPLMPDIPTASESGVPGYEANNWVGVVVRAGTPRARIERLNREIVILLRTAELREFLLKLAIEASPGTPGEFAAYIKSESAKWSRVVKASGVKAE